MNSWNATEKKEAQTKDSAPVKNDNVHHPKHYETHIDGLETIDMIYAVLGPERFEAYCRGNAIKYLARADRKENTIEDLNKAAVYLRWEIEVRKARERG